MTFKEFITSEEKYTNNFNTQEKCSSEGSRLVVKNIYTNNVNIQQ